MFETAQTLDSRTIARIQKLMAFAADSRGNENETAIAAAKLQALLAEYNIELSQVQGDTSAVAADPDSVREKTKLDFRSKEQWEVDLLASIARNNFCLLMTRPVETDNPTYTKKGTIHGNTASTREHTLIGRRINIAATSRTYEYLIEAMHRLNPYQDGRSRSRRSWFEGCASRLTDRLWLQRQQSEAASRAARGEANRGNGTDLVLSDIYSNEEDLNRDMRWGYEPGTTARMRAEQNAYYAAQKAAREANPTPPEPKPAMETLLGRAQRKHAAGEALTSIEQAALAKEAKRQQNQRRKWAREDAKAANKIDRVAYDMGHDTANDIGLDTQVSRDVRQRIL